MDKAEDYTSKPKLEGSLGDLLGTFGGKSNELDAVGLEGRIND